MNHIQSLIAQLFQLGLDKKYVRSMLPEWVEYYPPNTDAEVVQLKVYLASLFNLDLGAFLAGQASFSATTKVRYKRLKSQQEVGLVPATALFMALARYCFDAVVAPYRPLPENPAELRSEILSKTNGPLTLEALVACLWVYGIPVFHYSHLPEKLSRPDALVLKIGARPFVIVGGKRSHAAWHLFYVAHEVGHAAKNHLKDDDVLVDEVLGEPETNTDNDEREANQYASTLLCGDGEVQYLPDGVVDYSRLSRLAVKLGKEQQISPGHLLLRHAPKNRTWGVATKILDELEGSAAGAEVINRIAAENLDWASLAPESADIIKRALRL